MKTGKAFFAGVVGGGVMSLLMAIARLMGMPANLEMMLGTVFGGQPGPGTWFLGFIMHLMISGLIGLIYGWGFESVTRRAGWGVGLGSG